LEAIAREKAENLFEYLKLRKSRLYQNKNEIKVRFEFFDNTVLVMKYNCNTFNKTYYLKNNLNTPQDQRK
jgi:hypothetical protein